jgi:glycosyltransferase involved in cell wall biosynthesis
VVPAHDEGPRLAATITSIASTRSTQSRLEFVIADDGSTDDLESHLRAAWPDLQQLPRIDVRVSRLPERNGVPRARNHAASLATADILFITDAHVRFTPGWDTLAFKHIRADRILAGTITEANTPFVGYGCRVVVPFMGTYWNKEPPERLTEVQVAACSATVLPRELFERVGGYDSGMLLYGSAEPEFSVRAWLAGASIVALPELRVEHRFKPVEERRSFIREVRPCMVHNALRFGLLYLNELGSMQMLRYYSLKFPNLFHTALQTVSTSDVWTRRAELERGLPRPFSWFVDRFGLRDQSGEPLL